MDLWGHLEHLGVDANKLVRLDAAMLALENAARTGTGDGPRSTVTPGTEIVAFITARLDEAAFDPAAIEALRAVVALHGRMSIMPGHPMFNDAHLTREPMVLCRSCEPETMLAAGALMALPDPAHPRRDLERPSRLSGRVEPRGMRKTTAPPPDWRTFTFSRREFGKRLGIKGRIVRVSSLPRWKSRWTPTRTVPGTTTTCPARN